MKNWILNLFGKSRGIEVGTRVKYQGYEGTVIGGTLHVQFDVKPKFIKSNGPNYKSKSFNLDRRNVEIL